MSANEKLKQIVEAALLSAGSPLNLDAILELFLEDERPDKQMLRDTIAALRQDYDGRGIELVEVGVDFALTSVLNCHHGSPDYGRSDRPATLGRCSKHWL